MLEPRNNKSGIKTNSKVHCVQWRLIRSTSFNDAWTDLHCDDEDINWIEGDKTMLDMMEILTYTCLEGIWIILTWWLYCATLKNIYVDENYVMLSSQKWAHLCGTYIWYISMLMKTMQCKAVKSKHICPSSWQTTDLWWWQFLTCQKPHVYQTSYSKQ